MRIKDQFQNNFWDGIPLDNRASSHLRKHNQITSQLCHEGQPLDSFTNDYRKIPYFNLNPPVWDLLQASFKNDIDDQVEFDDFALVESHTQNDLTQNNTDHVLSTADVTIQFTGDLMPVDGNIRVSGGLTLVDVSTQTTGFGLTHDLDYLTLNDTDQVEFDDFALVESHTQNDLTQYNTDHVLSTADVTIQFTGDLMPVDGNIRVSGGLTLVDVNNQTTGKGQNRDNDVACVPAVQYDRHVCDNTQSNTGCGLLSVDGDIQVTGNNGVQIPHSIPKGITENYRINSQVVR